MPRSHAFTMLELLLVLTVLGILAALAAARLGGLRTSQGIALAAQQVQEQALRAQHLAAERGQPVRLRLDPEAGSASVQLLAGSVASDPADGATAACSLYDGAERLHLAYSRDDGIAVPGGPVDILFLPDARCDLPGTVALAVGERAASVRIAAGAAPPVVEAAP